MARFRDIKTLQKFASVHASIHNHFNHQWHLNRRDTFKQDRATALAEWCQLAASSRYSPFDSSRTPQRDASAETHF